jgi:O-antigen/teichoic acid export membrane protein
LQVAGEEKVEPHPGLADRVRGAVLWRSGSQIVAQLITWTATFIVIRLLDPSDYGLYAMTEVVLVFLNLMNGYGFASALVRAERIDDRQVKQVFGILILLNGSLAIAQIALAPLAAAYFRQPIIADLLRVQALIYLCTPFIAIPNALLSRGLDFRRQAQVNLGSAVLGAFAAMLFAWLGYGVWTLVLAPIVMFAARAVGMTFASPWLTAPSFRFKGASEVLGFGGAMVLVQFFWFIQSQSGVVIAGRSLPPHELGLYTTALFLTQILASKFVPPLNDVAFAAYSQIQAQREAVAAGFLKAVQLVMLVALPFYFGLAALTEAVVLTALGPKWAETVPLVRVLAVAMPFLTLQILFAPATNALGHARIALKVSIAGAVIMPTAFFIGIYFGSLGMAYAWLAAFPLLTAVTAGLSLPEIGVRAGALADALMPAVRASFVMLVLVLGIEALLPPAHIYVRLAILVAFGAAVYAGFLLLFARPVVDDLLRIVWKRKPAAAQAL